jgi:hypothetical protein
MPDYKLIPVPLPPDVSGKISILEINGRRPYEKFVKKAKKSGLTKQVDSVFAALVSMAKGLKLPPKLAKPLSGKPADDDWQEFRIRKDPLRSYIFVIPPDNHVIVFGEIKKDPKKAGGQDEIIANLQAEKQAFKAWYLAQKEEE